MKGTNGTIFAIGDCTATAYAPTAQAANQQGAYLARCFHQMAKKDNLTADINRLETAYPNLTLSEEKQKWEQDLNLVKKKLGKVKVKPFQYSHQGSLAYIGSEKAIADLPFLNGNASLLFIAYDEPVINLVTDSVDSHWRSGDIPFLEECIFEHPLFLAESYFRRYRLVDGQIIRTVSYLFSLCHSLLKYWTQ